jgi:two-component system, NarL family, response regulator NreC
MPIKVLVADDTEIVRRAIIRFLKEHPEIQLVGEAADFSQAARMAEELKPHVIVMDLHMPHTSREGDAVGEMKAHLNDDSHVLAISLASDPESKALAARFGATVLLNKMNLFDELIPAIMKLASRDGETSGE